MSAREWYNYFKQLLRKEAKLDADFETFVHSKLDEHDRGCDICTGNNMEIEVLNREIGIDEVLNVIRGLPNGKATGEDGFPYEMFKTAVNVIGPCLVDIFNRILQSGEFPDAWSKSVLCMLHKKDQQMIQITIVGFHCCHV